MITEYQNTSNEILISKVSMGNYVLADPFEEIDVKEVLMLHTMPMDFTAESSGTKALVEWCSWGSPTQLVGQFPRIHLEVHWGSNSIG